MKKTREIKPKIKLSLTSTDYILESIAASGLVASWILPAVLFSKLPEIIPTHLGLSGQIDGWGSKTHIFVLPLISLIVIVFLSILNKYPHTFNYNQRITEENAHQLYAGGTRIIRILKIIVATLFFLIECLICNLNEGLKLTVWLLPIILFVTSIIPIIIFFILSKKITSEKK